MKPAKTLAAVAALLLGTAALAQADQLEDIKSSGKLVCGTMGTLEPWSFQDPQSRQIVGYEVDLCAALAADLGVELEVKPIATEARIPELMQARVDVLSAAMGYTEERAQQIDYSNTSFVSMQKIMVKAGSDITEMEQINGKKISAPKGSSSERYIRELMPEANMLTFQDPPAAFLALQQSKVSALALSEVTLRKFIDQVGEGTYTILDQAMAKEYWGLGVRKNEPALLEAVNTTLARLEESGEAQKIFDRWFGTESIYKMERPFKLTEPVTTPVLRPQS